MDYGSLIAGAILVVAGGAVTYLFGWLAHRRDRGELIADRNRSERLAAYASFLESVNHSAHMIGNLAENPYGDRAANRQEAAYYLDQNVTPRLLTLRLVGTSDAVDSADDLHKKLVAFREGLTATEDPPKYRSPEYNSLYGPVSTARELFISLANAELGRRSAHTVQTRVQTSSAGNRD
jgi:hypothetical protein